MTAEDDNDNNQRNENEVDIELATVSTPPQEKEHNKDILGAKEMTNGPDQEQPPTTTMVVDEDQNVNDNIPEHLICPISQVAMEDPVTLVVLVGGESDDASNNPNKNRHHYNRQHLCESLLAYPDLNPLTGERYETMTAPETAAPATTTTNNHNEHDEEQPAPSEPSPTPLPPPLSYRPNLELRQQLIATLGPQAYRAYDDSDFEQQYQAAWKQLQHKHDVRRRRQATALYAYVVIPGLDGSWVSTLKRICSPYVMIGTVVGICFLIVYTMV